MNLFDGLELLLIAAAIVIIALLALLWVASCQLDDARETCAALHKRAMGLQANLRELQAELKRLERRYTGQQDLASYRRDRMIARAQHQQDKPA